MEAQENEKGLAKKQQTNNPEQGSGNSRESQTETSNLNENEDSGPEEDLRTESELSEN